MRREWKQWNIVRLDWLVTLCISSLVYVVFNSAYGIFIAHRVTDTHESAWGILIGLVAKIGMPILAGYKLKVAARLNSASASR